MASAKRPLRPIWSSTSGAVTNAGFVIETPACMSREQFEAQTLDAGSDIFSLGAVPYELATGQKA